jgi:hypothetical protein
MPDKPERIEPDIESIDPVAINLASQIEEALVQAYEKMVDDRDPTPDWNWAMDLTDQGEQTFPELPYWNDIRFRTACEYLDYGQRQPRQSQRQREYRNAVLTVTSITNPAKRTDSVDKLSLEHGEDLINAAFDLDQEASHEEWLTGLGPTLRDLLIYSGYQEQAGVVAEALDQDSRVKWSRD